MPERATWPEAADWDERYRAGGRVWSGRPNPTLVDEAADLAPGRALDLGCGEGADAIWLAARGWQVVAVDFAAALERGAGHARDAGEDVGAGVAGRVDWRRHDLRTWQPEPAAFDLVSAHFVHAASPEREGMLARWAAAVAPGGTLLVVAHSPLDLAQSVVRRPPDPALYATAAQSAGLLHPAAWVVVAEERPRVVETAGDAVTVHDALLLARRRPAA